MPGNSNFPPRQMRNSPHGPRLPRGTLLIKNDPCERISQVKLQLETPESRMGRIYKKLFAHAGQLKLSPKTNAEFSAWTKAAPRHFPTLFLNELILPLIALKFLADN